MNMFSTIDLAILSVGSWEPAESQLRSVFPEEISNELSRLGTRAEVAGLFINDEGELVGEDISSQCITISENDLLSVPRVVAVAGSRKKVRAIHALSRSGLITDLVTDADTARELLKLPAIKKHQHTRRTN
ncbi:sugar-binding domain-containing protein [Schaalia sp. ZJ405]|uniref:sugar-binding domain-containing protein n=1 Tax=Schaalia sp. ZJ405 TaxID=2709403 RepID=UPI001E4ABE54|nr:sugar-binding domain-containing protein [Schaalia sp. ZJ405]